MISECVDCGKPFEASSPGVLRCDACKADMMGEPKEPERPTGSPCVICGVPIAMDGKSYCPSCRLKAKDSRHHAWRYAGRRGDPSIGIYEAWQRFPHACPVCGREMSLTAPPNSDDRPSLDHIVPLSKGGPHEWSNIRILCRRCNSGRSKA